MESRRWVDATNSRAIPKGVGKGAGEISSETELELIFMAVSIRCAITHPAIFSRLVVPANVVRNMYALLARNISGVSSGAESVRLMVHNIVDN
jgi:hypothetical protein